MARSLSEGLGNAMDSVSGAMQRRTLAKRQAFEDELKLAELQSKGFNVQEQQTPRKLFGFIPAGTQRSLSISRNNDPLPEGFVRVNGDVVQDPTYFNAQKLREQERIKNDEFQRSLAMMNSGNKQSSGSEPPVVGSVNDQNAPFVAVGRSIKTNPAYVKPSDAEADKNKEEMLRQDAESQLAAIQETKNGIKYFGPAGNLPSIVAPSSLVPGEYGHRKEWENNVNKLLSGRIISLMNQMKQASKTGATGFGQLNKSELGLIQNASNVLSKDLPPDIAEKYLNQLEPIYQKILNNGNNADSGYKNQKTAATSSVPEFATVEEAEASGHKGQVTIGGRKAVIE